MPAHNFGPEAARTISEKTIVPVVGISAIGKNTLMRYAAKRYEEFHVASGFTTRPPRSETEDTYSEYLSGVSASPDVLFAATGDEELIQYEQHPTRDIMYGTKLKNYAGTYNMLDTLSGAVDTFRAIGFAACLPVVLVAEVKQWQVRFASNNFEPVEASKRIAEGIQSLEWSLDQNEQVAWLVNADNNLETTSSKLRKIAISREYAPNISAQHLGNRLLKHLKSIS